MAFRSVSTQQRQVSSSLPTGMPITSPNAGRGQAIGNAFPFLDSPTPAPSEIPLSPTDFPALSSAQLPNSGSIPPLSYASQAGTGILSNILNGTNSNLGGEFSKDDFPALVGEEMGRGEQASAVAALQLQRERDAHRAGLLGTINGTSSTGPRGFAAAEKAFNSKLPPATTVKADWSESPTPSSNQLLASQMESLHLTNGASSSPALSSAGPPGVPRPNLPPPSQSSSGTSPNPSNLLPPSTNLSLSNNNLVSTPAQQVLFSPADRYGLLGLLHIIKTNDPDLSMLGLGTDLTSLGLDLGATENLYSTFITPWSASNSFAQLNIEPEFHLPSCYNVQPPPAQSKIGNFSDETLFFIFYSQPRDAMQEMAAHELYKHNWRYHKELRLWLTKEAGTEPTQKTQSYERGSYIFFDPTLWERVRKDFVLVFESLERRL